MQAFVSSSPTLYCFEYDFEYDSHGWDYRVEDNAFDVRYTSNFVDECSKVIQCTYIQNECEYTQKGFECTNIRFECTYTRLDPDVQSVKHVYQWANSKYT